MFCASTSASQFKFLTYLKALGVDMEGHVLRPVHFKDKRSQSCLSLHSRKWVKPLQMGDIGSLFPGKE